MEPSLKQRSHQRTPEECRKTVIFAVDKRIEAGDCLTCACNRVAEQYDMEPIKVEKVWFGEHWPVGV